MSPTLHARYLARQFTAAHAGRFAQADVHAEPGRARLLYGPLPKEVAPDGLLPSALLIGLAADAAGLAAGTRVLDGGVHATRVDIEVWAGPLCSLLVATAEVVRETEPPGRCIHARAVVSTDGGQCVARLVGRYVESHRPLFPLAATDVDFEVVPAPPSVN